MKSVSARLRQQLRRREVGDPAMGDALEMPLVNLLRRRRKAELAAEGFSHLRETIGDGDEHVGLEGVGTRHRDSAASG